jgi:hypothetical protein
MSPSPHIAVLIRLSQGLSNIYRPGNARTLLARGRNFSLLSRIVIRDCAAKAFYYCPSMISHRPRSQNILKERALNPEKDSRIKIACKFGEIITKL